METERQEEIDENPIRPEENEPPFEKPLPEDELLKEIGESIERAKKWQKRDEKEGE